jgi:hypothetical protein
LDIIGGFNEIKEKFRNEAIDGEVLMKLDLNDLKDFDLKIDVRKKLFSRINDLREQIKLNERKIKYGW